MTGKLYVSIPMVVTFEIGDVKSKAQALRAGVAAAEAWEKTLPVSDEVQVVYGLPAIEDLKGWQAVEVKPKLTKKEKKAQKRLEKELGKGPVEYKVLGYTTDCRHCKKKLSKGDTGYYQDYTWFCSMDCLRAGPPQFVSIQGMYCDACNEALSVGKPYLSVTERVFGQEPLKYYFCSAECRDIGPRAGWRTEPKVEPTETPGLPIPETLQDDEDFCDTCHSTIKHGEKYYPGKNVFSRFCSRRCWEDAYEEKKSLMSIPCSQCGTVPEATWIAQGGHIFCNVRCEDLFKAKQKAQEPSKTFPQCAACGTVLTSRKVAAKCSNGKFYDFCDMICGAKGPIWQQSRRSPVET